MDWVHFFDMILHVDKTLGMIIAQYGTMVYVMLGAIVFGETGLVVLPFLPGDSLLFVAGAFCATGAMHIAFLIFLLVLCAVSGNTVNYWVGKAIGKKVFTQDYRWLDKKALYNTHVFFEKHGGKTILLARFVPIVRTFAPFVAGVSEMSFVRFQLYNITGAVLWVSGLVAGGYFFGNIPFVREHLSTIVLVGAASAIVPVLLGALWKFYKKVTG